VALLLETPVHASDARYPKVWLLALDDLLGRGERGAACIVVRSGGKDSAPPDALIAALSRSHPAVTGYPACGDTRLWIQDGQKGTVLLGDGFCTWTYRLRRRWFHKRAVSISLCE